MEDCCIDRQKRISRSCDGLWSSMGKSGKHSSGAAPEAKRENGDSHHQHHEPSNAEIARRHVESTGSDPNLLLYMVSDPPSEGNNGNARSAPSSPPAVSACSKSNPNEGHELPAWKKPRAKHIPPNTTEGVPIDGEFFEGKALVMYRPARETDAAQARRHPHSRYFSRKKRNWEFRVQGRFKRVPQGEMYIGIVLRDFNYDQAVARHSVIVRNIGVALIKYEIYISWGDRCEESKKPDAELSHLVTNMTGWDQIIVTPAGGVAPLLGGELGSGYGEAYGLNFERKNMGLAEYSKAVEEVYQGINTEDTYTMCFWGVSQVVDVLNWNFKMIGTTVSMVPFFEDCPIHVAMYELEPAEPGQDPKRHLESRKRYYLDFMFWSNSVKCPKLASRYNFIDAPHELECFAATHCNAPGRPRLEPPQSPSRHEEAGDPHHGQLPASPCPDGGGAAAAGRGGFVSRLAELSQRLRWIPASTCSMEAAAPRR
mmetsp:Transcript_8337/g.23464  ORF Transcript_8337/g.23464 Transcript_8337/m.23464 type:complete len:483 (-) Transcript_8337:234-1682(-)